MTTSSTQNLLLRTSVRGAYDLQKLRISTGNRIVANFKAKLGQLPGKAEKTLEAEEKKVLKLLSQRQTVPMRQKIVAVSRVKESSLHALLGRVPDTVCNPVLRTIARD